MFRLRALYRYPLRGVHCGAVCRGQVLEQLLTCKSEDHVFSVVGKNEAELTVFHVGFAMRRLCNFQKEKTGMLQTREKITSHPQFLTLQLLAENKISQMADSTLVEMLYSLNSLNVEHHDSLVQQLMIEGWNRLDRFSVSRLARFSERLYEQGLDKSPLMGQITDIVNQKLDSIEDTRSLTTLMTCIGKLVSPRLRDALIEKADVLLDSTDSYSVVQILRFFQISNYTHQPLLEKCNHILLQTLPCMEVEYIRFLLVQLSRMYNNSDFILAAKQRLKELIDTSNNPVLYTDLSIWWGPVAEQATRKRLESAALLMADLLNARQALVVVKRLDNMQCRNLQLIDKFASILQKNLEVYSPLDIARITQLLISLNYENTELFSRLKSKLLLCLQYSVNPKEVSHLIRALAIHPSICMDEVVISRIDAILPQSTLYNLNFFKKTIGKWIYGDPTYRYNTPSKYILLLQTLNRCGQERLQKADQLDVMLKELTFIGRKWSDKTLVEDTIAMLQRLVNQVSWNNLADLAHFLTKNDIRCTPILDRIANVATENIHKIHYFDIDAILRPFAFLNYNSPRVDELFDAYIQHFTPHISSINCCLLVEMAYTLAVANNFPEEVIREIFSVDFLAKLEAQLKTRLDSLKMDVCVKLMKLNRAVCLECPQFQVPWFHEHFCKQLQSEHSISVSPVQKQIHKMLCEVLGDINCARVAVLTPYFYTVDFEFVLDRHNQAVPYSELSQLQMTENGQVHWDSGSADKERKELMPGSRRIALDFLDLESYCCHSQHVKGEVLMRKRHLEILGYHVFQIPHFEWNSMELSSKDAWKEYLRKKLFTEQS